MCEVSIIIPSYKGSNEILIAVWGALSQTVTSKEIIVVDDNGIGTEEQIKTKEKLQKFIKENKIKYFAHEKNLNGSAARNTGIKASNGKYIAFLDDDDYIIPSKLEEQINVLEKTPKEVGMSVCEGYYVHKDGKGYLKKIKGNYVALDKYLLDKHYFNTSSIVIKRECLIDMKGFDDSFIRHQDWEFCTRMLSRYKSIVVHKPLFIKYSFNRNNPSNIEKRIENLDFFFEKMEDKLKDNLSLNIVNRIYKFK